MFAMAIITSKEHQHIAKAMLKIRESGGHAQRRLKSNIVFPGSALSGEISE